MTHQEYFEKVIHEYHQAGIDLLDTGIEESEKHIAKITQEEYEMIKKRFELASQEYFNYLGYVNKHQPDVNSEFFKSNLSNDHTGAGL